MLLVLSRSPRAWLLRDMVPNLGSLAAAGQACKSLARFTFGLPTCSQCRRAAKKEFPVLLRQRLQPRATSWSASPAFRRLAVCWQQRPLDLVRFNDLWHAEAIVRELYWPEAGRRQQRSFQHLRLSRWVGVAIQRTTSTDAGQAVSWLEVFRSDRGLSLHTFALHAFDVCLALVLLNVCLLARADPDGLCDSASLAICLVGARLTREKAVIRASSHIGEKFETAELLNFVQQPTTVVFLRVCMAL
ncbi:unnamed protein product [Symbiodinium sp. CCMP2592]|nr:unnamed protein product [Symbiodinium sp. CCMP2592]